MGLGQELLRVFGWYSRGALPDAEVTEPRPTRILDPMEPVPDAPGHFVAYIERPGAQPRWIDADAVAKDDPAVAELWAALNDRFPSTRMPSVLPALP